MARRASETPHEKAFPLGCVCGKKQGPPLGTGLPREDVRFRSKHRARLRAAGPAGSRWDSNTPPPHSWATGHRHVPERQAPACNLARADGLSSPRARPCNPGLLRSSVMALTFIIPCLGHRRLLLATQVDGSQRLIGAPRQRQSGRHHPAREQTSLSTDVPEAP